MHHMLENIQNLLLILCLATSPVLAVAADAPIASGSSASECGNAYTLSPTGDKTGASDYANINKALGNMLSGISGKTASCLLLQGGTYYINHTITKIIGSGQSNWAILGAGLPSIAQVTNGEGIFLFEVSAGATPNNHRFENLTLTWTSQQTTANPGAVGIAYRSVDNNASHGETAFDIYIHHVNMVSGFRGFANAQTLGTFPVSNVHMDQSNFTSMSGAFFYDVSPTSVAQPNISIDTINYSPYNGGSEYGFVVDACGSLFVKGVQEQHLHNQGWGKITGSFAHLTANTVEDATYGAGYSGASVYLQTTSASIESFRFSGNVGCAFGSYCFVIQQYVGSQRLSLDNIQISNAGTGGIVAAGGNVIWKTPPIMYPGNGIILVQDNGFSETSNNQIYAVPANGQWICDDVGDKSYSWTAYASCETVVFNTPLTANRTLTLTTGNADARDPANYLDGMRVHIVRTARATGSATLTVSASFPATKSLTPGSWAEYMWRRNFGSNCCGEWLEVASGTL